MTGPSKVGDVIKQPGLWWRSLGRSQQDLPPQSFVGILDIWRNHRIWDLYPEKWIDNQGFVNFTDAHFVANESNFFSKCLS